MDTNNDDDDDGSGHDRTFPALALKLRALGVESWQTFDASDIAAFRALVARLEDTKVRRWWLRCQRGCGVVGATRGSNRGGGEGCGKPPQMSCRVVTRLMCMITC